MNTYSNKIDKNDAEKVKAYLSENGAIFDIPQYTFWRGKTSDCQASYYTSGKLLIQGKNIDNTVEEVKKLISVSSESIKIDCPKYIGTDESGKGDFFGPLIVAGVQSNEENKEKFINWGIKDSKKLEDKKIIELSAKIKANSVHSIIVINPLKYNELYKSFKNLNKLLAWAHAKAIENILEKSPCNMALADKFGDESLIENALMEKGKKIVLKQMVRAESDIIVAAASVLARAEFVKRMSELEKKYELKFSKGASSIVIDEAKEYIKLYSYERLNEVAKMHFKTVQELK